MCLPEVDMWWWTGEIFLNPLYHLALISALAFQFVAVPLHSCWICWPDEHLGWEVDMWWWTGGIFLNPFYHLAFLALAFQFVTVPLHSCWMCWPDEHLGVEMWWWTGEVRKRKRLKIPSSLLTTELQMGPPCPPIGFPRKCTAIPSSIQKTPFQSCRRANQGALQG